MSDLPHALLAIHALSAAAWVGGMAYALLVLRPALDGLDPAPRLALHVRTLKRFFIVVWHAMPLLWITGLANGFLVWGGLGAAPWTVHAMLGLAVLMTLVFVYVVFGPFRRLRRAIRPAPEIVSRIRAAITLNLALGVATIAVAELGHNW